MKDKDIMTFLQSKVKVAFFSVKGTRVISKKISIKGLYEVSGEDGKLDQAGYNLFSLEYLRKEVDKLYNEGKFDFSEKQKRKNRIDSYELKIVELNEKIIDINNLKKHIDKNIKICKVSKGILVYTEDLKYIDNFKKKVSEINQWVKENHFDEVEDALKENLKLKALCEAKRHSIKRDKADKVLSKAIKDLDNIVGLSVERYPSLDISDEVILDDKSYNEIMKSNLRDDLKSLITEYRKSINDYK